MKIKRIKDLSEYEGEFIVTDGLLEVEGTCISLPLSGNRIPEIGTQVAYLNAFFLDDEPIINKLQETKQQKYILKKKGLFGMSYYVQGYVFDADKYLIKVLGFIISLEYLFGAEYSNKTFNLKNGDWVSFIVDRFDITLR